MNLDNWTRQAKAHWKEHQPSRYKTLKQQGTLDLAARQAAEQTLEEVSALEEAGYQPDEAFQMVRERYLFPPEESAEDEAPSQAASLFREALGVHRQALNATEEAPEVASPREGIEPL